MIASTSQEAQPTAPQAAPRDGGYVLVMLAMLSVVLIAFAGYSVDVGNWGVHRNKAATVSEAAALGGVAFLPDDFATAKATAEQIALDQGFTSDQIDVRLGAAPNQLQVTITEEVENYFVRVIGKASTRIHDTSVAEFEQPVEMGSPTIGLGNDPDRGFLPNYWLSIASRSVAKDLGDRFATRYCDDRDAGGCTGRRNDDYDNTGYKYAIRVTDASVPLRIQVFDPAWTWTGSTCTIPTWPTAAEIAQLRADAIDPTYASAVPHDYYDDADVRYQGGESPYCTGDDRPGADGTDTEFRVRLPDTTPWDDNDNATVPISSCKPYTFVAYTPTSPYAAPTSSIYELLSPSAGPNDGQWRVNPDDSEITFAESFRRWVTLCEIPPGPWLQEGDYIIQVRTGSSGEAQNRFALRAGPPDSADGILDTGQALNSRGRLPIFANTTSSDTRFFVARVPPSARDRVLKLTFFDIGDADAPGSITIEPGPDSNMSGSGFTDCTFQRSDVGDISHLASGCTLSGVWDGNGYGEQIVEVELTVPREYSCTLSDPDGCWVSVRVQFPGGITDATTWTAQLVGDAVRLVS